MHLRARLERVLEPHRDMDRVLEFSSGEGLLRWVENHPGELNLIFLDMEMGQLDGMETARRLRQIEESLPLVFVTGYTEHVFEGYTVGALGYLLKPVREDQLKEVLSRGRCGAAPRGRGGLSLPPRRCDLSNSPEEDSIFYIGPAAGNLCDNGKTLYILWKAGSGGRRTEGFLCTNSSAVSGADTGGTADLGQPSLSGWADTAHQPVLSTGCDDCPHPGLAGGVTMDGLTLPQQALICLTYGVTLVCSGLALYGTARRFLTVRSLGWGKAILFLTFGISTGMVIWVGDPNLLYVFPLFVFFSMLSTQGDWMGRLAVTIIFFCIIMSVCAILDTYIALFDLFTIDTSDFLCRLMRPLFFALLYLLIRRRMPVGVISLSRRLWKLILGLSFMPLCALMAVVLLTYRKWDSMVANSMAMNQGMVVLPFTGVTALILLFVILTLANHEKLEQEVHLAGLREVYYQGIQREQVQVRTLRHDLRNHMTVLRGLLESGETEKAIGYLEQITDSSSLGGGKPFSDNETANVVLTAKAKEMRQRGIQGEFQISLPRNLLIAEMDLCALLGNALDNAMEAAEKSTDKTVRVRCRAEKGLFMLQVDNALAGDEKPDLSTTKKDKTAHGFGLLGMREIAKRYGGSFEVVAANGRFELVVCLPL